MFTMKQARLISGKTQKELAGTLGICPDTYRALEKHPARTTIKQAIDFCAAVKMSVDDIFFSKSST